MAKIELNNYDLQIKTIEQGGENIKVVQIRSALAFNEDFIEDMRSLGVSEYIERDEKGDTQEGGA